MNPKIMFKKKTAFLLYTVQLCLLVLTKYLHDSGLVNKVSLQISLIRDNDVFSIEIR